MLEKNKKISVFKVYKRVYPMVVKSAPLNYFFNIIIGLSLSLTTAGVTVATQVFFDSATELSKGEISLRTTILSGIFLGFLFILNRVLNMVLNLSGNVYFNKAAGYITNFVNKKASKIEPINYENSETLDYINKAHQGVMGSVSLISILDMIITTYGFYFVFMGVYLYKLNPILIFSIVCVFIPVIINQFIKVKIYTKLEDGLANTRREYDYYEKCIIDREFFKETRLLGAFNYFNKKYKISLDKLNKNVWEAEKKHNSLELLMKIVTSLGYGAIMYLLFSSLMSGKITIGAFGAVLTSIGSLMILTEELISMQIGKITANFGAVKNLINFLDLEEREGKEININNAPSLELKNLSFNYPNSEKLILDGVNLEIKPKETIAIVGENGAGKSTLMKIILGLYLPTQGQIKINGIDMKELSPKCIFKNTSAVFQKFQKYKFTLRDNILISNINMADDKKIKDILKEVEIDLKRDCFKDDLDTMLSREFGGIDLSGGQWQRIAIGRGLYNFSNLIILDEPTAAIDPIEEGKIFSKFKEIAKGKTAVIITHRMGTVKIADKIVVLDKGRISEMGTHEEMMKTNGKYKEMYEAQSKWYEVENI